VALSNLVRGVLTPGRYRLTALTGSQAARAHLTFQVVGER
jgi:hypothetical protein